MYLLLNKDLMQSNVVAFLQTTYLFTVNQMNVLNMKSMNKICFFKIVVFFSSSINTIITSTRTISKLKHI